MTTGRRNALVLTAVVVAAVVAFIILKPSDKKTTAETSTVVTTANGRTTTTVEKPPPATVVQVNVKNGKPVGGIKKISVNKGDPVRFRINSDVSDEIHVHGYDFKKDVKAGGSVQFSFPAKIDGEFVVELENHGEQIASLEVQP